MAWQSLFVLDLANFRFASLIAAKNILYFLMFAIRNEELKAKQGRCNAKGGGVFNELEKRRVGRLP